MEVALPPFFAGDQAAAAADGRERSPTDSWELIPEAEEDPRWDQHGFRRDASSLEREEAFKSAYAGRLEQQEQRWSRWRLADGKKTLPELPRAELKRLARMGIPAARRRTAWPQLCRASELRSGAPTGYFAALLAQPAADASDPPALAAERQIDLDLARTFPGHRLLSSADGAQRLRSVLVAYARRNPRVGYVQGMGFVAALLLIFVEEPEEAFWCLAAVVEYLLPPDYYAPTLLGLRAEQAVFVELVAAKLPRLAPHLQRHCVVPELFAMRWFVAIFANALPVETTLRVFDAFLLEGVKVLHRVGLSLLRIAEPRLLRGADQQELLMTLQDEQANCLDCERLLSLSFDRHSFLRSFPRARIDQLRRKHRARILAAEQGDGANLSGAKAAAEPPAAATRASTERRRRRRPNPAGAVPPSGTAAALDATGNLAAGSSSEDESDHGGGDDASDTGGGYDVVSFDDLSTLARQS